MGGGQRRNPTVPGGRQPPATPTDQSSRPATRPLPGVVSCTASARSSALNTSSRPTPSSKARTAPDSPSTSPSRDTSATRSSSAPDQSPTQIYGGAYQGIGAAYYDFGNPDELGNPIAVYLFQGARIARISPRLSFNYEWNFGLSFGWKPYDDAVNPLNKMMGSKMNAYLNADFFLDWRVTREVDFTAGLSLTHFSNGNTKFPNAGLNAVGLRAGLTYNFGRKSSEMAPRTVCPAFPRHFSYDLTFFGSWRRKGIEVGDKQYAAPDAYTVLGFNFASMYNFGYKFRAGVSLDGVYDGSANVAIADQIVEMGSSADLTVEKPGVDRQLALGVSARAEFVMPYFNIGVGLGTNFLHKGGDLKAFYQMLTLKVAVTRSSYVHIGYSLRDFHMPNFLMLGVGYRFNNKYPRHR